MKRHLKILNRNKQGIENLKDLGQTFIDADQRFISLKDENLKYLFVNKALASFFQKEASMIIGRDDFALTDKELAALFQKTDMTVLEKRTILRDELMWENKVFESSGTA
ncbi:MAG TPA: hypothetical protein GXX46_02215 [Peptococcaceae bacterium]|nr:hypothetical protein [Peptococcaceae bacterium]